MSLNSLNPRKPRLLIWLIFAIGCVSCIHSRADTIISVTGMVIGGVGLAPVQSMARGWTQSDTFYNVSINATIGGLHDATTGSGTAYLMNQIGPSATVANEIAEAPFTSTNVFTDTYLFSGLTLAPATYYLVLSSPNQAFWDNTFSSNSAITPGLTTAPGVLDDGAFVISYGNPYPPANAVFVDSRNLLFSVSGLTAAEVPEPATWFGAVAAGCYLLRRRRPRRA